MCIFLLRRTAGRKETQIASGERGGKQRHTFWIESFEHWEEGDELWRHVRDSWARGGQLQVAGEHHQTQLSVDGSGCKLGDKHDSLR